MHDGEDNDFYYEDLLSLTPGADPEEEEYADRPFGPNFDFFGWGIDPNWPIELQQQKYNRVLAQGKAEQAKLAKELAADKRKKLAAKKKRLTKAKA